MYDEVNEAFDQVEALVADEGIDCDYRAQRAALPGPQPGPRAPRWRPWPTSTAGSWARPVRFVRPRRAGRRDRLDRVPRRRRDRAHRRHPPGPVPRRAGPARPRRRRRHPRPHHAPLAIEPAGPGGARGYRLITDRGVVEAGDVVVATNAYADGAGAVAATSGGADRLVHHRHRGARPGAGPLGEPPRPHDGRHQEPALLLAAVARTAACCSAGAARWRRARCADARDFLLRGRWCASTRSWRARRSSLRVGRSRGHHARSHAPLRPGAHRTAARGRSSPPAATDRAWPSTAGWGPGPPTCCSAATAPAHGRDPASRPSPPSRPPGLPPRRRPVVRLAGRTR